MILEVNLVKTQASYSPVGVFLERKRYEVNDEVSATSAIIQFLGENNDILNSMMTNKSFVDQISSLKVATADTIACVRAILAQENLDVWAWAISEVEVNPTGPDEDNFEYNIVDNLMAMTESTKFCTKILMAKENISYSRLYKKIAESYNLFSTQLSPIFTGVNDPYSTLVSAIETIEGPTGSVDSSFVGQLSDLCKFLGKSMYVILDK